MRLTWDEVGSHFYKAGVDRCVLYPMVEDAYQTGVAWSGITDVEYSPTGNEKTILYTGDVRSRVLLNGEEFGGSISAYFYPDEFDRCIGNDTALGGILVGQQERAPFGLCYRTMIGNDTVGNGFGYQIHVLYEAYVTSIKDTESTINENLNPTAFNWSFECVPVDFPGYSPVSHLAIDSRKYSQTVMAALEDALWGSDNTSARLLMPEDIYPLIQEQLEDEEEQEE